MLRHDLQSVALNFPTPDVSGTRGFLNKLTVFPHLAGFEIVVGPAKKIPS